MTRKINSLGGEIMKLILQQMYLQSNPTAAISNPLLVSELKNVCSRSMTNKNATQHLEDYLDIMSILL